MGKRLALGRWLSLCLLLGASIRITLLDARGEVLQASQVIDPSSSISSPHSNPGMFTWTTGADFAAGVLTDTQVLSDSVQLTQTIDGYAPQGVYLSAIVDAGDLVEWASAVFTTVVPVDTAITLSVRVGNSAAPDVHWTDWRPLTNPTSVLVDLPPSRYFQWTAELASAISTTTPSLEELSIAWNGFNYTPVGGTLSVNTTWHAGDSPYLVTTNLLVSEGITLTIEPGVTVWFSNTRALQVWGGFTAMGTPTQPITFTSWHARGQPDDWGTIAFYNTAISASFDANDHYVGGAALRYATVEYAGSGSFGFAVDAANTSLYVDHSTIWRNGAGGVKVGGGPSVITHNDILRNTISYPNGGGGIRNMGNETLIADNVIRFNQNGYEAGGIYNTGDNVLITRNTITDNRGQYYGGGIDIEGGHVTIQDNIISNNTAMMGAGIRNYQGSMTVTGNLISGNAAESGGGGGILTHSGWGGYTLISGNIISGNSTTHNDPYNYNGGGGIAWSAGDGAILYNTIISNTSADGRSGLELGWCIPVHYNTFEGNPGYAFFNRSTYCTSRIDARHNWWGTTDDTTIKDLLYDWFDDTNQGVVDYQPYLTSRADLNPAGLTFNGPVAGLVNAPQSFDASVFPLAALPPFTFTWQADGQTSLTHSSDDLYDAASFTWDTPGAYTLTLSAQNSLEVVTATHVISINSNLVPDAFEDDDACPQAGTIAADGGPQTHTFDSGADEDWLTFVAVSGTTYVVEAMTPDDSLADVKLELYGACGGMALDGQNNSFSPDISLSFVAQSTNPLFLHLTNQAALPAGGQSSAYRLSVRALASTPVGGAIIIVAGKNKTSDLLQSNIYSVTNAVYRLFLANGYPADRIHYLAPSLTLDATGDGLPDVDALSSSANLQQAITTWASNYVDANHALTLYLMDHGDYDAFYLNFAANQRDTLNVYDLNLWLDALETARPGLKVNLMLDACHSGSFIDLSQTISQPGRVIVASTGAYPLAYASPTGALFSDAFVAALGRGMSLYASFEEARWAVAEAHPDQTPWLDDNGNGLPNEEADGQEAMRRGFAYAGTFSDAAWPPYIAQASFNAEDGSLLARVSVPSGKTIARVWALIYPPSYQPPASGTDIIQDNVPQVTLTDPEGDGLYTGLYSFTEAGTYRVVVYATDSAGLNARPRNAEQPQLTALYLPLIMR